MIRNSELWQNDLDQILEGKAVTKCKMLIAIADLNEGRMTEGEEDEGEEGWRGRVGERMKKREENAEDRVGG